MKGHRPARGIALIALAALCFATMDTTIKYLGAFLPVLLILWARYAFQAVSMGLWLMLTPESAASRQAPRGGQGNLGTALRFLVRSKTAGFRTEHPRFQLARGALLLATSALSFFGVQRMPVAEFTAINMLTPVVVTLLAAWVLHERVSAPRWALVCAAFAGAVIVIRPGSGLFGWAVLFPLAGALTYASFQVLTSKLSALESPYTTHFYTGLTGALVLTPLLFFSAIDTDGTLLAAPPRQLALLLAIGALGTVGHLFLILALGLAPTATLMPFIYLQIGVAAAVSWVVFRYVPDGWAWVGMGVIAVCGAASAWLNMRKTASHPATSTVAADTIAD
ncbi:DMT family transporter [Rhizobacter sp. SG703]|uniref:EamA family transporter n=1 Tax=Rhizobacter sp. SG703 TaxID=2587140 RepID=UPI001446AA91|nr:drug/metabolite transporter (DMT)-like permease [Rhizobacter sp. SG703]